MDHVDLSFVLHDDPRIAGLARDRGHEDIGRRDDDDAQDLPPDLQEEVVIAVDRRADRGELFPVDADRTLLNLPRRLTAGPGEPALEEQVLDRRADEHRALRQIGRNDAA